MRPLLVIAPVIWKETKSLAEFADYFDDADLVKLAFMWDVFPDYPVCLKPDSPGHTRPIPAFSRHDHPSATNNLA
jgi:hypothetical protein